MKRETTTLSPDQKGRILDIKVQIQKAEADMGSLDYVGQVWWAEQIKQWKQEIRDIKSGKL